MALDIGYHYTNGISYPQDDKMGITETHNQLYGDALQNLCRETNYNKLRLKKKLFKTDREKAYDIVRWEFGKPNKENLKQAWYYDGEIPSWEDEGAIFDEETGQHFSCNKCEKQNKEAEDQCYLCSTLEEHQQHMVRKGVQLKRKEKPKPRIKFIPPPPTVKYKEKEVEEKAEVLYKFSVKTGGHVNAATNATVTVKLKGDRGIMRKKVLKKKTSTKFVFGRNTTEVFYIKGPEIGDLNMLAVECLEDGKADANITFILDSKAVCQKSKHDGLEQSHAWFLEEVEVIKMNTEQVWLFVCKDWLSLYHGHGQLKQVLRAQQHQLEPTEYEISVVTADKMFSGTDANVYITLYGKKGVGRKLALKNRSKNPFEKGSTENFFVTVKENIGPIRRIRVEHDNTGSGPGWLLEQVTVNDLHSGQRFKFPCGQWLATDEGDGQIARDLYPLQKGQKLDKFGSDEREDRFPLRYYFRNFVDNAKDEIRSDEGVMNKHVNIVVLTDGKVKGPVLRYEVNVLTGKVRYAGTDARVYLTLVGKRGRSSEVELFDTVKDLFEMGQTDVFRIQTEDVGEIKRIQVRHDNSGLGAGWFLEKMTIKRYFPKEEVRQRLMKFHGPVDESVSRRGEEDDDIDSPRQDKTKVTGSVKIKKKEESESDSDVPDATGIFSSYKKKTKKQALRDQDDDKAIKKYRKEKKKQQEKKKVKDKRRLGGGGKGLLSSSSESDTEDSDSEETEGEERESKTERWDTLKKKKKWITYGGYRMQVTDDELEASPKKHKRRVKYPTDSSSDSEDDETKDRNSRDIRSKYSKYMSDSEDNDLRYRKGSGGKNKKRINKGKKYTDSEDESDTDEGQKGRGHKKHRGGRRKGYTGSNGEDEQEKAFSSLYKKDRVPFYDEYLFECHKWLAADEDDGKINREFNTVSVTTFYKMKN